MDIEARLRQLSRACCEDALFAILGTGTKSLEGVARRRAPHYEAIARGATSRDGGAIGMAQLDEWMVEMAAAIAPIGAPWFVPMHQAIDDGLTLEREGAKGLGRSLQERIFKRGAPEAMRRAGAFAVRVIRAVSAADGAVGHEERRSIDMMVAALGLPEDDARVLRAEGPMPIASLEVPPELEWNLARAVIAGAFHAAAVDGVEPAEHAAIVDVAARLHVQADVIEEARVAAERATASQLAIGVAAIDAIRYVVQLLPEAQALPLVVGAAHLAIPPVKRPDCLRAITSRTTTPLAREHGKVDKSARGASLAAAWAAALSFDPTSTMRARLVARHDRVSTDLGSESAGRDARGLVDEHVEGVLARGVAFAGG